MYKVKKSLSKYFCSVYIGNSKSTDWLLITKGKRLHRSDLWSTHFNSVLTLNLIWWCLSRHKLWRCVTSCHGKCRAQTYTIKSNSIRLCLWQRQTRPTIVTSTIKMVIYVPWSPLYWSSPGPRSLPGRGTWCWREDPPPETFGTL